MKSIESVKNVISKEFALFESEFGKVYAHDNQLLSSILQHLSKSKGKQVRPLLVLLAAKLCGAVNNASIHTAISLELLHTASLIHDDIVDESDERRGQQAVHVKWNNKVAVLGGDYMLSNSLNIAVKTQNIQILELISDLGKSLADGELLQLSNTRKLLQSEQDYYTIIRKKTALLFSVCTTAGAVSVDADSAQVQCLKQFGELLGMCFQIQDDIFDYSENLNIGKPVGNDISEGKVTLPLILALRNTPNAQILDIVENKRFTSENINHVLSFVRNNGGIQLAQEVMERFRAEAASTLCIFPDGEVKTAMLEMLEYITKRNK